MSDPITRLAESWWVTGPLRWQRRYPATRGVVGDWHGVALLPPLAVVFMVAAPLIGFAAGATSFGYVDLYSESAALLVFFIALGAFSGQLGLAALVGFALGDFFFAHTRWRASGPVATGGVVSLVEDVVRARVPLLISYLLLAVAVIVIPRMGKNLALGVGRWQRIPADLAWLVTTPVLLLVSWLGLRTWAAAGPTLMRPYFVWPGGNPTVPAIAVFQRHGSALVAAGVGATLLRQIAIGACIYIPTLGRRLDRLEARGRESVMAEGQGEGPRSRSRRRLLIVDVVSALVATLVLSGIIESKWLWLAVFGLFLLVRLLRSGALRMEWLERWKGLMTRVPVVVRLGLTWLAAVVYGGLLSDELIGSYTGMTALVMVGLLMTTLLFPGEPSFPVEPTPARSSVAT